MESSYYFAPAAAPAPILYRAPRQEWSEPTDLPALTIPIPNLFGGKPPTVSNAAPFAFDADAMVITVASGAGGIWDFSPCANGVQFRPALAAAFVSMLTQIEASIMTPRVDPNAVGFIQQSVAVRLPLTFAETLFYRYSFMFTGPQQTPPAPGSWVDLLPGMRLRIDSEAYQMINPSGRTGLNGFVPAGTTYIEVGSWAGNPGGAGLNPFLTEAVNSVEASSSGIAGAADLMNFAAFEPQFFRLLYPPSGLKPASSLGWNGTQFNATILAAPTRAALEQQTQYYLANGTVTGGTATWFNGRCLVTPEIPVNVAGQWRWAPLGTTIRNVLEGITAMPLLGLFGLGVSDSASLACWRSIPQPFLEAGPEPGWRGPQWAAIQIAGTGGYQYYEFDNGIDSFDLPLIGGDIVTVAMP